MEMLFFQLHRFGAKSVRGFGIAKEQAILNTTDSSVGVEAFAPHCCIDPSGLHGPGGKCLLGSSSRGWCLGLWDACGPAPAKGAVLPTPKS